MTIHRPPFNRAFREVMTRRNIIDLTLKMQAIKVIPQDKLTALFFEMCDWAIDLYIKAEQEKTPEKKKTEIMREYYQKSL